jgi:hypothetical protein
MTVLSPQNPAGLAAGASVAATRPNTPVAEICEICAARFRVEAHYDDPWKTPITLSPLLVEYTDGGVLSQGGRTQGLATFGLQDGMPIQGVRPELGAYADRAPRAGGLQARLVPEGGADPKVLEQQIIDDLVAFARTMETAMAPWNARWQSEGWTGLFTSLANSIQTGFQSWLDDEGDFWNSVTVWLGQLPDRLGAAWDSVSASAKALWENRDKIVDLLKSLAHGTVAEFERGIEAVSAALQAIPGLEEIASIFLDLITQSAEWAGAMIELSTRSKVLAFLGATMLSTIMMIPPIFWSDMVGLGVGYIIPEVFIAIVLAIIAFFTGGTGGAALAARIATYLGKVKAILARAGRTGQTLLSVFNMLSAIGGKIMDLIRALKARIAERAEGATGSTTRITRRVGQRVEPPADIPCFEKPANVSVADFEAQIREQEAAINNSDISELQRRRAIVAEDGTGSVRDRAAQETARAEWLTKRANEIREQEGLSRAEARAKAQKEAAQLDATHVLDIIAGGDPSDISGLQNRSVNRSIGAQWPGGRVADLDRALADQAAQGAAKAHVKLKVC